MKRRAVLTSVFGASVAVGLGSPEATAQWIPTNGPVGAPTTALHATPAKVWAVTAGAGVFVTTDSTTWTAANSGLDELDLRAVVPSAHLPDTLLVGTQGAGVYQSANGGTSWVESSSGLADPAVRVMASIPDPYMGTVYFAATPSGVFRSNTHAALWWSINGGLTGGAVQAFAAYFEGGDENDGIGAHDLLAGTNGGGVFLSTDGVSWNPKSAGLTNPNVTALAASSSFAVTFAGTAGGGVFRSSSIWGGWTPINDGLTSLSVTALAASGTSVFAGTAGGGVFVARDDGASGWTPANTGLSDLVVSALATDGTYLFAATGAGVFRRPLADLQCPGLCPGTEVSPPGALFPLRIEKSVAAPTGYHVYFEKLAGALGYNIYSGTLGTWFDHGDAGDDACDAPVTDLATGEMRAALPVSAAPSAYYLVTGFDGTSESVAHTSSSGTESDAGQDSCLP